MALTSSSKGFYLAPDFECLSSQDLFLLGFYADSISVSDGYLFWQFLRERFPILSSVSTSQQSKIFREAALLKPKESKQLSAYADLVECGLIKHEWLASDTWDLKHKRNDSRADCILLDQFSEALKRRRSRIVTHIETSFRKNPKTPSAKLIRDARKQVGHELLCEIIGEIGQTDHRAVKLKRRIDEHLRDYIRSEKAASEYAAKQLPEYAQKAGCLADLVKDCRSNPNLIPVYTPATIEFLSQISKEKPPELHSQTVLRNNLSREMGVRALQQLRGIEFQDIEQMLNLKEKLGEELQDFNERMSTFSQSYCGDSSIADKENFIQDVIKNRLNPSIRNLEQALDKSGPSVSSFLKKTSRVALSGGGFYVGLQFGLPIEALFALGIPVAEQLTDLSTLLGKRTRDSNKLFSESENFGLSLIMKMKGRN